MKNTVHLVVAAFLLSVTSLQISTFASGEREEGTPRAPASPGSRRDMGAVIPEMVRIPEGKFLMGEKRLSEGYLVHEVHLGQFCIGKYEVTNRQFALFVEDTSYKTTAEKYPHYAYGASEGASGSNWRLGGSAMTGKLAHPVVYVSYLDAIAYCEWLSRETGHPYRLPTEAEWEKAARGGLEQARHVWGEDQILKDHHKLNIKDPDPEGPIAVGTTYPPNAFGLYNMSGNVREICSSLYVPYPYDSDDGRERPHSSRLVEEMKGMAYRLVRGGVYYSTPNVPSWRAFTLPKYAHAGTGFRIASSHSNEKTTDVPHERIDVSGPDMRRSVSHRENEG